MSDRADEISHPAQFRDPGQADELRELITALDDAFPAWDCLSERVRLATIPVRAYLNEKPHEPQPDSVHFSVRHADGSVTDYGLTPAASPPHAAALPEEGTVEWWMAPDPETGLRRTGEAAAEPVGQPVAWYMPIGGRHSIIEWGEKRPDAGNINEWRPLYASPLAQPIARDEQDAKRYRWIRANRYMDIASTWLLPHGMTQPATTPEKLDAAIDAALKSAGKE